MDASAFLVASCLIFLGVWNSSLALKEPFFTHMASCVGEPITAVSVPQKDQAALAAWNNLFRQSFGGGGAAFGQLFHKAKSIATSSAVLLRRWNRCLKTVCIPDTSLKSVSCRALYFSYNPHKHACTPQRGFCQRTVNHFASMEDCRLACTSTSESGRAATLPTPQDTEVRLIIMRKKNGASVTLVNSTLKVPQKKNLFFVGYLLPDPYGPLRGISKNSVQQQSSVTKVGVRKPEASKIPTPPSVPHQPWQSPINSVTGYPQGTHGPSKTAPQTQLPKQVQGMLGAGPMAGPQPFNREPFPTKSYLPSLPHRRPPPFLFGGPEQQPNLASRFTLRETGASQTTAATNKTVSTMPTAGQSGPLISHSTPGLTSSLLPQSALMSSSPLSSPPSASPSQGPPSEANRPQLPSGRAGDSSNASEPRQDSDMSTLSSPTGIAEPRLAGGPITSARPGNSTSGSSEEESSQSSPSDSSTEDEDTVTDAPASNTSEKGTSQPPKDDLAKGRHARELPPGLTRTKRVVDGMPHRMAPISGRSAAAREDRSREPVVEEKIVPERAPLTGIRPAYRRSLAAPFATSTRGRGSGAVFSARWQPRGSRFPASISL